MKKRILSLMLAALMLLAIVPFAGSAADNEVDLYLGFGTWNGSQFSGGLIQPPHIGAKIPDVSGLKVAVVLHGATEAAEDQTTPYTISDIKWDEGVTQDAYGDKRFAWYERTTLTFNLKSLAGTIPTGSEKVNGVYTYPMKTENVTLKTAAASGVTLSAKGGNVRGDSVLWTVTITWTKRICIYGEDEATFVVSGNQLANYKEGDAFPTYTVTGERAKYFTVETNWYYAEGTPRNYTRGTKVTESAIRADVPYDCELTLKLKSDAPVLGQGHYIASDGSAECVLYDKMTSEQISGYFSWGTAGLNDNPNNKTLTVRKFVTFKKLVKNIEVLGVTAPVVGKKPVDYGISIAEPFTEDLEVKGAKWTGVFDGNGAFKAGEKYTLTINTNEGGDLRELDELNKTNPKQGYKLVTAEGGTVVSFHKIDPVGLQIVIEYIAEPEDLGVFSIIMNGGKITVEPSNKDAFNATMNAMADAIDFSKTVNSSYEYVLDLDKDGTPDVVVQNGNQYQPYDGHSVPESYTVTMSPLAYSHVKASGALAYYSKVTFVLGANAMPGDANGDGKINARDVIIVMQAVIATTSGAALPSSLVFSAADMNGDGKLNARDVILVMQAVIDSQPKG